MYGIEKFHKGIEDIISEIIGGIAGDAILLGFVYIIPNNYRTLYFIIISIINIIGMLYLVEKFEYAAAFYAIGWLFGFLILATVIEISFLQAVIWGVIPFIILMYKLYKQTKHTFF